MDPLDQFLPAQSAQGAPDPLDAFLQPQVQAAPAAPEVMPEQAEVNQMGTMERVGAGILAGLGDVFKGAQQYGIGQMAAFGAPGAAEMSEDLKREAGEERARKAPLYDTMAGTVGQVLPSLLLPGSTIPKAILSGAAYGGLQPTTEEGERERNALMGGAAMGAGTAVGQGVGAVINRVRAPARGGRPQSASDAVRAEAVKEAEEIPGMKVSVGARTGGRFARGLESVFEDIFPTSRIMTLYKQGNQEAVNRQIGIQFGEEAPVLTRDVFNRAKDRVGAEFDKYVRADAPVFIDSGYMSAMSKLKREVELLPEGQRDPQLAGIIRDYYDSVPATWKKGQVQTSGAAYKANRTRLTNKARSASQAGGAGRDVARQIDEVVRAMDDMAGRAVPQELQEGYALARKQYQGLRIAEDAVDEFGNVTPAALKGAIRRHIPREGRVRDPYRKVSTAMQLTKEGINNSGTPSRLFAGSVLAAPTLALTGIPGIGAESGPLDYLQGALLPLGVQAAMLNPVTARYITRQLSTPGPGQQALLNALGRAGGLGGYAAGQELSQ